LELLEIFKKDNLVEDYKVLNEDKSKREILEGLREAVQEVKLYEEGKTELLDARKLLDDL